MKQTSRGLHVVTTTRTYKGKTYRSHLLRRSYREGGKVKKQTLANLTRLGDEVVEVIRQTLRGAALQPVEQTWEVIHSYHHGHVLAVLETMQRLQVDELLGSRACRERTLAKALIAARLLEPQSKLATWRSWGSTTLPTLLGVEEATEYDLYAALDWLGQRQSRIEKRLAQRHLTVGGLVLYDLSSSYLEGQQCPLGAYGYNRDGKRGKLQITYGLLTTRDGCPVSVSVFEGNTADASTLLPQVQRLRQRFGIERLVIVGDRGLIAQVQIEQLKTLSGVDWITALRSGALRRLLDEAIVTGDQFEGRPIFELCHPDFPGERLVACYNPAMAQHRAAKRQALLEATEEALAAIQQQVKAGRLRGQSAIGLRVGKLIHRYKMAKHFVLTISEDSFAFARQEAQIHPEAALDGIYVIRTNLTGEAMTAAEAVRSYKQLSRVEQAFRALKTIDLHVRPIFHRLTHRVKAHVFLCLLAYYIQWHLVAAWRPLLFHDEDHAAKATRDPVAPARRSDAARQKAQAKRLPDGSPVHSFRTLLIHLSTIVRNVCRPASTAHTAVTFTLDTQPDATQQRAYELLKTIQL